MQPQPLDIELRAVRREKLASRFTSKLIDWDMKETELQNGHDWRHLEWALATDERREKVAFTIPLYAKYANLSREENAAFISRRYGRESPMHKTARLGCWFEHPEVLKKPCHMGRRINTKA